MHHHPDDTIGYVSPARWHEIIRDFRDDHYQLSAPYVIARATSQRAVPEFAVIRDAHGMPIGAAAVRIRSVPMLGGVAYIAGGPVSRRDEPADVAHFLRSLAALRRSYVDDRGFVLRVLGPLGSPEWNAAVRDVMPGDAAESGRHYRTFLVDLRPDAEALRQQCSKYWRRNLRRGEEAGASLAIECGPRWYKRIEALYEGMVDHKQFTSDLSVPFYAEVDAALADTRRYTTIAAHDDEGLLSAMVLSLDGDTAVPLIAATSQRGRRSYAAYRVHWEAMLHARARGCTYFDLGGIDPVNNPSVCDFKRGLRGSDLTAPGPVEFAPISIVGALTQQALSTRDRWRRAA